MPDRQPVPTAGLHWWLADLHHQQMRSGGVQIDHIHATAAKVDGRQSWTFADATGAATAHWSDFGTPTEVPAKPFTVVIEDQHPKGRAALDGWEPRLSAGPSPSFGTIGAWHWALVLKAGGRGSGQMVRRAGTGRTPVSLRRPAHGPHDPPAARGAPHRSRR
jgi:hypothetical protein